MYGRSLNYIALLLIASTWMMGCQDSNTSSKQGLEVVDETKEMIQLVNEAYARIDYLKVPYAFNKERTAHFLQQYQQTNDINYRVMACFEMISAGLNEQAIVELEKFIEDMQRVPEPDPQAIHTLRQLLALSYYRMGEVTNCVERTRSGSCLFPITEEGHYTITTASERAVQILKEVLTLRPDTWESRWLLNLAYMNLGRYPQEVPKQWLIPPDRMQSDYTLSPFQNIAAQAGVNLRGLSGGVVMDDFNNDGWLDLFISAWGPNDQLRLFLNKGDGTFTERTKEAGLTGIVGGLQILHADYDNDGHKDLLILRGAWYGDQGRIPNSLLRNNGDGTFTDVTKSAGLLSYHPTQAAVWADFNRDGWLDLFIGNESTRGDQPCELYISNGIDPATGRVTFTNRIQESGLGELSTFVKAAVSADINNDGWPDLYLSNLLQPNFLLLNKGVNEENIPMWENISYSAGTSEPIPSFPAWFWDFDNDGWEDIMVFSFNQQGNAAEVAAQWYMGESIVHTHRLYRNNGDGTFTDVAGIKGIQEPMLAMGSSYGDITNNGYPDMYVGTGTPSFASLVPNKMFLNREGKSFVDVTTPAHLGHLQKGHGVAFGDFDNDGDLDIYTVLGGAYEGDFAVNALFLNPLADKSPWLRIQLEGTRSNRSALGAKAILKVRDANGKSRSIYKTVSPGGSFGGNCLDLFFGLGKAEAIEELKVLWPNRDRTVETFTDLPLRSTIRIVEGNGQFDLLDLAQKKPSL